MNEQRRSTIIATGSFLPEIQYDITYFKKYFPEFDETWIKDNLGTKTRYSVTDFETGKVLYSNSDLACLAAKQALQDAQISVDDIDLIITTTATPDYMIPNMACIVQDKLKAHKAAAIGLLSGCAGFVYALTIADSFIRAGIYKTILITGSEVTSAYLDFHHPKCIETQFVNAMVFADGAGAAILTSADSDDEGIIASYIGSNGKDNGPLIMPCSGSVLRPNKNALEKGLHFWDLDFRSIIAYSGKYMAISIEKVLSSANMQMDQIDWMVPHQPTLPIIKRFAKKMGFPLEKMIIIFEECGNTADACLPISLDKGVKSGKIKKGNIVALTGSGAGWMYGANLMKWSK